MKYSICLRHWCYENQLDFPTLFGSSTQGWCAGSVDADRTDMAPLDLVREHVAPPSVDPTEHFWRLRWKRMLTPVGSDRAYRGGNLEGERYN